jgi:hypothetical protein
MDGWIEVCTISRVGCSAMDLANALTPASSSPTPGITSALSVDVGVESTWAICPEATGPIGTLRIATGECRSGQ